MIAKIDVTWNENYQYDGYLYFFQRVVEMLDYMTNEIYRSPLVNISILIDEYISISYGHTKPYQLEEVYNELLDTLEHDAVLEYKIGKEKVQQIINQIKRHERKRLELVKYLRSTVVKKYLDWSKEYIKYIVPQSREKHKIEKAIRAFLPELFRCGYSRDEVYHSARAVLFHCEIPSQELESFLNQYRREQKEFDIYLELDDRLFDFKDVLKKRLGIKFEDDGNFAKLEAYRYYSTVKFPSIKALDASSAANKAFKFLELFTTFYQFFGNYSGSLVQRKILAISKEGYERVVVVDRRKYKSIEDDNPPRVGTLSETVVTNLIRYACNSVSQLEKITTLHNRAISDNGLENGFLNLWSIMEVVCVTNPENSKIEQVKSIALPILRQDYLFTLLVDLSTNLKNVLSTSEYTTLLESITDGEQDYEKIAAFVLLPKYCHQVDDFVDCLVNYPVLRTRILNLRDNYQSRKGLTSLMNRYNKRASWQIYRIYRARNSIVHAGKSPNNLKDLGEQLHAYVDSVINEVILKLGTGDFSCLNDVLVDSRLKQEIVNSCFNKDDPLDFNCLKLIFDQMASWTSC